MSHRRPNETIVKEGTYLYDGAIECDVRIVHSSVRFGSGDDEDEPEIANDLARDTYYIHYGSTTERGRFNAGGSEFPTLAEAVAHVESAPGIGRSVRWNARTAVVVPGG
jgi:hypothetical protein